MKPPNLTRTLLPPQALRICQTLLTHSFQAYIVGGAIRDALLEQSLGDIDIATNATPTDIEALFSHTIPMGKSFGTITVVTQENTQKESYQLTTFRKDGHYSDTRHPDTVTFSQTIQDDLSRRDFTINAMAWDPLSNQFVDPFNGIDDLKNQQLQTVGAPTQRFSEDSLRLFRLCRFQAKLGFTPHPKTLTAATQLGPDITLPSPERIQLELQKLLSAPHAWTGLTTLNTIGILLRLLPITLTTMPNDWPQWTTHQRLAYLIQPLPNPADTLKQLRFPKSTITPVLRLIENNLNSDHANFTVTDLAISGTDLINHGLSGPEIKQVLLKLRTLVLSNKLPNTTNAIAQWVQQNNHLL